MLGWVFRGHPFARSVYGNIGLLVPAIAVCVVIGRRRGEWRGAQRVFWDAFLIGMILWITGHVGWAVSDLAFGNASWVQWHTLFSLCGGLGPLVALVARPQRGPREEVIGAIAVNLVSYAMLAGFIYAYFVLVPSVVPAANSGGEARMLVIVQIQRLLLVVAMGGAAYTARRTAWASTYRRLLVGVAASFFLRLVSGLTGGGGSYHSGVLFDLVWIVPFLSYAWAAMEAPATPDTRERPVASPEFASSPLMFAVPVLLVPLLGYGLLRVQPLGDPGDSFRVLLTTLTTIAGLGLLTLRLSLQGDELQRADERLQLLAAATEQTDDLLLITGADGAFEHANEACVRALGYSRGELSTMTLHNLLEPECARTVDQIGAQVRQNGVWRGTLIHQRRDGTTFPAASTVVALRDVNGRVAHFVGVERDITEDLRLRDQLVHSERMSAIGELVAGVAHEINNPLQTIIGCTELLLDDDARTPELRRDLELVQQQAARAGQIVKNLLAFVHRSSTERAQVDLNQLVRTVTELRGYHLSHENISLVVDLEPDALPVHVNRDEIQQIVFNLLLNAEQAIAKGPGSGTIVIRTRSNHGRQTLQVTDDGPGISPDLRGRVFEPFFTTKEVGQGTGLGLSISLGIARAHGGRLELCETLRGACFRLTLPAFAPAAAFGRASQV